SKRPNGSVSVAPNGVHRKGIRFNGFVQTPGPPRAVKVNVPRSIFIEAGVQPPEVEQKLKYSLFRVSFRTLVVTKFSVSKLENVNAFVPISKRQTPKFGPRPG